MFDIIACWLVIFSNVKNTSSLLHWMLVRAQVEVEGPLMLGGNPVKIREDSSWHRQQSAKKYAVKEC